MGKNEVCKTMMYLLFLRKYAIFANNLLPNLRNNGTSSF